MTKDERLQTIENCMNWAGEREGRAIKVDYDTRFKGFSVWCYDYDLTVGVHITAPHQIIDLDAEKERQERRVFEALSAKFAPKEQAQ